MLLNALEAKRNHAYTPGSTFILFTTPSFAQSLNSYFKKQNSRIKEVHKNVQTKDVKYISFVEATTPPALHLNKKIMDHFRPELKKYYYDPSKYKTYLEQLGIQYPQLEKKGL
jgi:aminobenzoyl-glutamate utilization protein B